MLKIYPKALRPGFCLPDSYRPGEPLHRREGERRLVPLNTELHNGDIVEILASKAPRAPSRDWLNQNLGYIKTTHARAKIKQWFTKQERTENVERGREMLDKFMRHLGIKFTERDNIAKLFSYDTIDEFYAALGYGGITTQQIAARLSPEQPEVAKPAGAAVVKNQPLPSGYLAPGIC